MKCQKCKKEIPNDSTFCNYCGTLVEIPEGLKACPHCGKHIPEDSGFCQFCGSHLDDQKDEAPSKKDKTKKQNGLLSIIKRNIRFPIWAFIIAVALIIALIVGYIWHFNVAKQDNDIIDELSVEINELNDSLRSLKTENEELSLANEDLLGSIEALNDDNSNLESQISNYQKANTSNAITKNEYETVIGYIKTGNIGYSSDAFYVSEGIIVMGTNQSRTIKLITDFGSYASISASSDHSNIAWATFNDNNWERTTTLTIHSSQHGVAKIHFTNSINNTNFDVIVIVTNN